MLNNITTTTLSLEDWKTFNKYKHLNIDAVILTRGLDYTASIAEDVVTIRFLHPDAVKGFKSMGFIRFNSKEKIINGKTYTLTDKELELAKNLGR